MSTKQFSGRKMQRNHSNALPGYVIAYATETRNVRDEANPSASHDVFYRGAILSCRLRDATPSSVKPKIINSSAEFWSQLEQLSAANYTTWVVGHSVLYDMLVSGMQAEFEQARIVVDWPRSKRKREDNQVDNPHASALVVLSNPPTIVACRCVASGGRVVIVDLLNWLPASIGEIEETVDADANDWRKAINGCGELDNPSMRKAGLVLSAFLRLSGWSRQNDMGMFRYTASAQAMSAYRHRFMTHDIMVHDNKDVKRLERAGNFGGRTELFRPGAFAEKMHQLDVSSLFPAVMQTGNFPTKLEQSCITDVWSRDLPPIRWRDSIARVWIDSKNPIYPVRTPNGNIYPTGEYDTVLCGAELEAAHLNNDIAMAESWAEYETAPIFTLWVDHMWALRRKHEADGDMVYSRLVKLMLNGLYGKFAQKSTTWQNVSDFPASEPWAEWTETNCITGDMRQLRSFGWQTQEFQGTGELRNTFVAVSAFVGSAARMRMNKLRQIAGRHNVYYQGIDGLIVTDTGRQRLYHAGEIQERTLGLLRHQLTVDEGEILGYCDYRLGKKIVKSGLAGNAVMLPDLELMQQITHVSSSLFCRNNGERVLKLDTPWRRQPSQAQSDIDQDGFTCPFVLGRDRPALSTSSGSVT